MSNIVNKFTAVVEFRGFRKPGIMHQITIKPIDVGGGGSSEFCPLANRPNRRFLVPSITAATLPVTSLGSMMVI